MKNQVVDIIKGLFKEKHLIPLLLAIAAGIFCFRFIQNDVLISILIGIFIFILALFVSKFNLIKKYKNYKNCKIYEKIRQKEEFNAIVEIATDTQIFFRLLSDTDKNILLELYKQPIDTSFSKNERFILSEQLMDISNINHNKISFLKKYILIEHNFDKTRYHIKFTPLLYLLIENYSKNGLCEFPSNVDFKQFIKCYEQQIYCITSSNLLEW